MEHTTLTIAGFVVIALLIAWQTNEANKLYIRSSNKSDKAYEQWQQYCKELSRCNDIAEAKFALELSKHKSLTESLKEIASLRTKEPALAYTDDEGPAYV